MVNKLHERAIGIVAIEGARTIAMRLGCLGNGDPGLHQFAVPRIYVIYVVYNEADVIQPGDGPGAVFAVGHWLRSWRGCCWLQPSVQREIVGAGTQEYIVGVRLPLDAHAEQFGIEV